MAKPVGLMQRGSAWGIRVRVPEKLREQIGSREIWSSFGRVSYVDACRLARMERVAIDCRFREAEAALRRTPPPSLTDQELAGLARAFLHKMEVEADPLPLNIEIRRTELESVEETAFLVAQTVEDATIQSAAKAFAEWAGKGGVQGEELVRVSEALQQAWLEHLGRRAERLAGRTVETIDPIFSGVSGSQPLSVPLTVAGAIEAYKNDPERSGVAAKARAAWKFRFRAIEELLGPDRLIGSVRREDVRACRDALMQMPANAPKHFPGLSVADATVRGEVMGLPKLSAKSVKLYVELLSSLFNWLEREEMVPRNPAQGLKGPPQPSEKPKRPLMLGEVNALLAVTKPASGVVRPWTYWMVRIALLNGMRLGEIAGLAAKDVMRLDGVWVFRIRPNAYRELKTEASRRDVPIHPRLIEDGFLSLLVDRPGEQMLFADAPKVSGTSNAAQKRLGRVVRSAISDRRASFHSLRHNFRDALRVAAVPHDIAARLGGWVGSGSGAMEAYGSGYPLDVLAEWIGKVHYRDVKLS